MVYKCPVCDKIILREYKKRDPAFEARNGATLLLDPHSAPRVRCGCGRVVVVIKATLA